MAENRRYFSEIMNMNAVADMDTEEEEEKSHMFKEPMRRNLLDVFDKSEPPPPEVTDERMCVFLRVRPFSSQELEAEENRGCVEVQNHYMVTANAPKESHTFKTTTHGLGKAKHNFTFSRVFPEDTTQKEFFDATMLKLVQDFIEGQNCLVFTYGVTNSGKTYTIQGNPREAGVLPRGLDVIFNSISGKQWPKMDLKPCMFNDVVKLSPAEEEEERKIKERTLKMNSNEDMDVMTLLGDDVSDQSVMNATSQSDNSTSERKGSLESQEAFLAELENRVREKTAVNVADQGHICFSVWVSFAEIYNEQIFDLLEPMPKKKNVRRPMLKLSEDRRGSPYIKGLKEINVTSADEAYKLLTIGQRNLKTACTRLNHCSSRSHCIFNIKIVRVADKGNPEFARVSMLTLCDLAGSERNSKAQTTGDHLKEAGSINNSLHTLGRCIELLRFNQLQKKENKNLRIIPFRDSKLTRLFQNFFCGRGKASMIVNVSQCASMFDETLNVFKFSAIAKQVVMPPKTVEKSLEPQVKHKQTAKGFRATSICWDSTATPSLAGQMSRTGEYIAENDIEEEESEDESAYTAFLEEKILELQREINEMKRERLTREMEIRREVCKEMQEQFVKIEDMYSNMLKETQKEGEERLEKKLKIVTDYYESQPSKRPRLDEDGSSNSTAKPLVMVDDDDEWVSSLLLHQEKVKVQEREASLAEAQEELGKLCDQVTELQFQVADLARKNKDLTEKAKTAEEKQKQAEKECEKKVAEVKSAIMEASKLDSDGDLGQTVLLETLGKQLQEAKDRLRQQEKEMADLNDMLTDAGDTFHQKEEEITKLKAAIEDGEEKATQQVEMIHELRELLEESKQAVEESEKRIEAKNQSICSMKDELAHLQKRLKDHKVLGASEALKKCEEELVIAKARIKREEEDFQQREKALIHGYTAEINNLKSQMALLKSQKTTKCVAATSPVVTSTPERLRSPRRRRKPASSVDESLRRKEVDMDASFRMDVVRQLKDLQSELNQNRSMSAELRQKLQDARQSAELLQQQLEGKAEVEACLEQTQYDLAELQGKFEELSTASSELQHQLGNQKKELQTELSENQSESADLRQKLRIVESSADDLEKRLERKEQQQMEAESRRAECEAEVKAITDKLKQAEKERKALRTEVMKLQKTINSLTEAKARLESDQDSYKVTLESCQKQVENTTEEKEQLQETVNSLEEKLKVQTAEVEKMQAKNEELETVVNELRAMISQTVGDLETRSQQLEMLEKQKEESSNVALSNESQLKMALSEANYLLQTKTQQCESLQQQVKEGEARVTELLEAVKAFEMKEEQLKEKLEEAAKQMEEQGQEVERFVKEVETMKMETTAALQASQDSTKQAEAMQQELQEKMEHVEALEQEIQTLKESHRKKLQQLEERHSKLQSALKESSSALTSKQQEREDTLKELQARVEAAEKLVEEKEQIIIDLQTAEKSWEEKQKEKSSLETKIRQLEEEFVQDKTLIEKESEEKASLATQVQELERILSDTKQQLEDTNRERGEMKSLVTSTPSMQAELEKTKSELDAATLEIADLRSKLHMDKVLLEKYKQEVATLGEKKHTYKKQVGSVSQEVDKLQKERDNLLQEVGMLKDRLNEMEEHFKEQNESLQKQLSESHSSLEVLRDELERITQAEKQLQQSDMQKEKIITLETKVKKLEASEEKLKEACDELTKELDSSKQNKSKDETTALPYSAGIDKEQLEELKKELESERSKNAALEEQLECVKSLDTVNDPPGSSRRLRKEKIKAESELANVRFELERLQRQLEKKVNSKQFCDTHSSARSKSCSDFPGDRADSASEDSESAQKLQAQLEDKSRLLQEVETKYQRCECELLEVKAKLSNTEIELEEVRLRLREVEKNATVAGCSKQSVTRLQSEREALIHAELKKSQERESSLRKELQQASITMATNNATITDLEEKLSQSNHDLEETRRRLRELEVAHGPASSDQEVQRQMVMLEEEIERKDQLLTAKKARVKELAQALANEQAQRDLAVKDAKANEHVVQQLKDALMDQEETMAKQDAVLNQKDEEIKTLTTELERITDRYEQLINQTGDSSRELQELTRSNVRMEAQKDQLVKERMEVLEEKSKLAKDLALCQSQIETATLKLKSAEEARDKVGKELAEAIRERDDAVTRYKSATSQCEELEKKLCTAMEEQHRLQQQVTSTAECRYLVSPEVKKEMTERSASKLEEKLAAAKKELAKVKKGYERDTKLYLDKEASEVELKTRAQVLDNHVKELEEKLKRNDEEKQDWREQKNKMVSQLEALLTKQSEENKTLKAQRKYDQEHYGKLLDQERTEKQELKRQLKVLQRAKDSIITDLRQNNHQLQGKEPPPRPPPPQHYSFRVNDSNLVDDIDTTGHLDVDATPPVAAKGLRKSRKRTSSQNSTSSESGTGARKTRRRPAAKQDRSMEVVPEDPENNENSKPARRLVELEERVTQSPFTRSAAKKLLDLISPDKCGRSKSQSDDTAKTDEEETPNRSGRYRLKEETAAPFNCAPYQPPVMETRQSSRLRGRRQTSKMSVV